MHYSLSYKFSKFEFRTRMNEELNSFIYFNYDVIWCKVFEIRPVEIDYALITPLDERNNELIESFHKNPADDELVMRIIDIFNEQSLGTIRTPENFNYTVLLDKEWRHIDRVEAESVTDLLITESDKTHNDYLEEHKKINNDPIEWEADNEWVDYQKVKELFYHKTFDDSKVQFYTNSSLQNFEEDRYNYPCIIAIDYNKIGFLWFMT